MLGQMYDDIYDDLILNKDEPNSKEKSFQFHGNEEGDLSGIYLEEHEYID